MKPEHPLNTVLDHLGIGPIIENDNQGKWSDRLFYKV